MHAQITYRHRIEDLGPEAQTADVALFHSETTVKAFSVVEDLTPDQAEKFIDGLEEDGWTVARHAAPALSNYQAREALAEWYRSRPDRQVLGEIQRTFGQMPFGGSCHFDYGDSSIPPSHGKGPLTLDRIQPHAPDGNPTDD